MGDAENVIPASKKRAAGREISKDNPGLDDEEDSAEQETGTFKRASDEVLATRRIVKVRRNQNTSASANPFAGIHLVPPTGPAKASATVTTEEVATSGEVPEESNTCKESEKDGDENEESEKDGDENKESEKDGGENEESEKDGDKNAKRPESKIAESNVEPAEGKRSDEGEDNGNAVKETTESKLNDDETAQDSKTEDEKAGGDDKVGSEENKDATKENADQPVEGAPLSSFQQLSSTQNAFTGLAGTGFSTSTFTFGSISKDASELGTGTGPLFRQKIDQPSFGFGLPSNGSSSLFNTAGSSVSSKSEASGFAPMQEKPVETGEENERVVFSADSVLFEFLDGAWKERGKGELKVNISTLGTEKARLLMRARGNYRLILNASLYPDMRLTNMDKRGITFACMNSVSEGKNGLSTFALKFKDVSVVEEFRAAVTAHKGKAATVLKTPENSP